MTEKGVQRIKYKLSGKVGSPLYRLFYKGMHHIPIDGAFFLKRTILEKLGIPIDEVNPFEYEGIRNLLFRGIGYLRKGALRRKQPWIDFTPKDLVDRSINSKSLCGFIDDVDKAEDCIESKKKVVRCHRKIARATERNLNRFFPQIKDNVVQFKKVASR